MASVNDMEGKSDRSGFCHFLVTRIENFSRYFERKLDDRDKEILIVYQGKIHFFGFWTEHRKNDF